MFREPALGRIEDEVFLMHAAGSMAHELRANALERPPELARILDVQFDLGLAGHLNSLESRRQLSPASDFR